MTARKCTACGKIKPLEEFHKSKSGKYGHKSVCKPCNIAEARNYAVRNQEKVLARQRQYRLDHLEECREKERRYARHNAERKKNYMRKRYQENRTRLLAECKDWYQRNREKRLIYSKKHYEENSDRYKLNAARYRSRLLGDGGFTSDEWVALCEKYGNICLRCGSTDSLEADHVIPVSMGGKNEIENIQPLCHQCNNHKRANIIDWRGAC